MKHLFITSLILASLTLSSEVRASEIIYRGINPDITPTANPANEPSIAALSGLTKPAAASTPNLSTSELLKESIIGGISENILSKLNSTNPGTGNYSLGGGSSISYYTSGGTVYITVTDADGTVTNITQPVATQ